MFERKKRDLFQAGVVQKEWCGFCDTQIWKILECGLSCNAFIFLCVSIMVWMPCCAINMKSVIWTMRTEVGWIWNYQKNELGSIHTCCGHWILLEKITPLGYTDNFTWTYLVNHCTLANLWYTILTTIVVYWSKAAGMFEVGGGLIDL